MNEAKLFIRPRNIFILFIFPLFLFLIERFISVMKKFAVSRGEEKNFLNYDTREIRNASDSFFVEARSRLTADACNTEPHQFPQK